MKHIRKTKRGTQIETTHIETLSEMVWDTSQESWKAPNFADAIDVSEYMRVRRRNRRSMHVMYAIGVLLIVAAICVGGFPVALQYRSAQELNAASQQSAQRVENWPYPQADEAFAAAQQYNEKLAQSGQPVLGEAQDPFVALQNGDSNGDSNSDSDDSSMSANDEEYQSLLDTGDGVMGTIRIPKISVNLPIYHGTSENVLASGAGHLYGTSLPVGGTNTHAVITGHRGMVSAAMFTRIDELRVGDYFYIDVMGRTLGYKVDRISVIEPNDTSKLKIVDGEDRVTLMTCTPYGVNTHRLLVSAVRSSIPDVIPAQDDAAKDVRSIAIAAAVVTLLLGLALLWLRRKPWHICRHASRWPKRG